MLREQRDVEGKRRVGREEERTAEGMKRRKEQKRIQGTGRRLRRVEKQDSLPSASGAPGGPVCVAMG